MHDHPGRVQHPPQRRPPRRLQLVPDPRGEITRIARRRAARRAPGRSRSGRRRPRADRPRCARARPPKGGLSAPRRADYAENPPARRARCFTVVDEARGRSHQHRPRGRRRRRGCPRTAVPRSREAGRARARDRRRREEQGADRAEACGRGRGGRSPSVRRAAPTTCAGAGWSRSTRARPQRAPSPPARWPRCSSRTASTWPRPWRRPDMRATSCSRSRAPTAPRSPRASSSTGRRSPRRRPARACGSTARLCSVASPSIARCSRPPTSGCARRSATRPLQAAASEARTLLARPVAIDYHGARLGALTPAQTRARRFGVDGADVRLEGERLARVIRPRLGRWIVRAHNAQFVVAGSRVRIVPSRPGRDVDGRQFAAAVTKAAHGSHVAHLQLGPRDPDLTTAKAKALGIRQELVSYTTQMGESSSNRIHNVHLMADFIDGTIVEPGEVFSFNDVVGPRTAERGSSRGRRSSDRSCCPRSAAESARRRRRSSTMRSRSGCRFSRARITTSTSRTIRSAAMRRWRGAAPTFASRTT